MPKSGEYSANPSSRSREDFGRTDVAEVAKTLDSTPGVHPISGEIGYQPNTSNLWRDRLPTMDKPKPNNSIHPGIILGGILGVILLLARSPAPIDPAPGPNPQPAPIASSIERETALMIRDLCEGYRTAFRSAADQIGSKITTEEQLLTFLATETMQARESAKRGFDQSFETELNFAGTIPESEYARARQVLERVAKSLPTIRTN